MCACNFQNQSDYGLLDNCSCAIITDSFGKLATESLERYTEAFVNEFVLIELQLMSSTHIFRPVEGHFKTTIRKSNDHQNASNVCINSSTLLQGHSTKLLFIIGSATASILVSTWKT